MAATVVFSLLATIFVIMLAFPKTPIARILHRALVENPIRFIHGLTWKTLGKVVLSAAALALMMAMGPQMLALMLAIGADAAFFELLILTYAASASDRIASALRSMLRAVVKALGAVPNFILRRSRRREGGRTRNPRPRGGTDDESGPRWSFA